MEHREKLRAGVFAKGGDRHAKLDGAVGLSSHRVGEVKEDLVGGLDVARSVPRRDPDLFEKLGELVLATRSRVGQFDVHVAQGFGELLAFHARLNGHGLPGLQPFGRDASLTAHHVHLGGGFGCGGRGEPHPRAGTGESGDARPGGERHVLDALKAVLDVSGRGPELLLDALEDGAHLVDEGQDCAKVCLLNCHYCAPSSSSRISTISSRATIRRSIGVAMSSDGVMCQKYAARKATRRKSFRSSSPSRREKPGLA